MNILFIGNSYTYFNDMPMLFKALSEENSKAVNVYSVTHGGHKLYEYARGDDEYTKKIAELLKEYSFDICFLQEQSVLPIKDYELFEAGLTELKEKLSGSVKKFILYQTWGRAEGNAMLEELGMTNKEMTEALVSAYDKAAKKLNAEVSPVGESFYAVYSGANDINLYNDDLTHSSYKGSCLAALVHYKTVFGSFPENTDSLELMEEELLVFKKVLK